MFTKEKIVELNKMLERERRDMGLSYRKMATHVSLSGQGLNDAINAHRLPIEKLTILANTFKIEKLQQQLLLSGKKTFHHDSSNEELFYTLSSGEKVSFKEIALICGENEDVLMNFKAFSNIIDIRVAKALAIMSADPNKLAEFLNS